MNGKPGYLHLLTLSANQRRWERSSVSFRLLIRRALVIFVFGCIKLCASCVTLDSWVECLILSDQSGLRGLLGHMISGGQW